MNNDNRLKIAQKISEIRQAANEMPCVVIVHNVQENFSVEFMSDRGISLLGISEAELIALGTDYYDHYFNPEEFQEQNDKIFQLLNECDSDKMYSFFQQVRAKSSDEWTWFMTTLKIFMFDDENKPLLTISNAFPIDPEHQITTKVARLLEENNFLRHNNEHFSKLSRREKEIFKLMVLGEPSQEIAAKLFITLNTVKTHRKKILQKLDIKNALDLNKYGRAFDVI